MIHFPNAATNNVQRVNEPHLDPDADQNARSYVSKDRNWMFGPKPRSSLPLLLLSGSGYASRTDWGVRALEKDSNALSGIAGRYADSYFYLQ